MAPTTCTAPAASFGWRNRGCVGRFSRPGATRPKNAAFRRFANSTAATTVGSAFFQMNQKRGVRWHATKAFLRPALSRPNLTVMTHALVERVRIGGSTGQLRAEGIEFSHPREGRCFAQATAEIILAAGSIGSPQVAAALRYRTCRAAR